MTVQVPAAAYAAYARGEITKEELQDLEKYASHLNKQGSVSIDPTRLSDAATLAGLALAAPALTYLGAGVPKTIDSALDRLTFERDLRKVLAVHPQLGSIRDENLRRAYKTLRTMNAEYARDPLIAGTLLDMVMTNRMNPDDPKSPPRFDPALLQSIQEKRRGPIDVASMQASAPVSALTRSLTETSGKTNHG
jgi:hypothetical protein